MSKSSKGESPATNVKHEASKAKMPAVIASIGIAGVLVAAIVRLSISGSHVINGGDVIPHSTTSPPHTHKVQTDSPEQTVSGANSEHHQGDAYAIEFPDGERVTFRLRTSPSLPPRPDEKVIDVYDELSAAANLGDADAAMVLTNLLERCRIAPRSEQDLQRTIDYLYQTRFESPARIAGPDDMRLWEERFRKLHEQCGGLSDSQIDEADHWLQLAATLGNSHALMSVAQTMLGHRDPKAEHYLELAWQAGDLQAASHLWYFYSNAPPDEMDLVKGYAYKYIHDRIVAASVAGGAVLRGPPFSPDSTKDAAMRLNPRQQREALSLAKDLLRQNPSCCFSSRLTK